MDKAHRKDQDCRLPVCALEGEAVREQEPGHHDEACREQLDAGLAVGVNALDALVRDDHQGIEDGGPQAEGDAPHVRALGACALGHARDQRHAGYGQACADGLAQGQPFPEEQGRQEHDERRRHVVAQGRYGYRGVPEGLEEQNPVDGDEQARGCQPEQGAPGDAVRRPPWPKRQESEDEETAEQPSGAGQKLRGKRNVPSEDADGAEDEHG